MKVNALYGGKQDCNEVTLSSMFEDMVNLHPSHIALKFKEKTWTFAQVKDEVLRCIFNLKNNGATPGDVIAVNIPRSDQYAIITLAIILGGFVYLPVAVELPEIRTNKILDIAQPLIIITTKDNVDYHNSDATILTPEELLFIGDTEACYLHDIPRNSVCYIIFTSGSTGEPKGVKITHDGLINRFFWARDYYSLSRTDVILCKTAFTFDPSIQELVLPFLSGATLLIADPELCNRPSYIIDIIGNYSVSMLIVVPSLLTLLLRSKKLVNCQNLKHVICCGEPWGQDLIREFYQKLPFSNLYNGYGPTEATIGTLVYKCPNDFNMAQIPIGNPIHGVYVAILDDNLSNVDTGNSGELFIGGVCVSSGYINNEELNKEKFMSFVVNDSEELNFYRTGDIVKKINSGEVVFLGRKDNQIKIDGVRVEPEEIESVIKMYPGVIDAIVFKKSSCISDSLHATFIAHDGIIVDTKKLQLFCLQHLNRNIVPGNFHQLKNYPLNQNGKVDRKLIVASFSSSNE